MKTLPPRGLDAEDVLRQLRAYGSEDADWRGGRTWSLVYWASDAHTDLLKRAYELYFSENGLSPLAFPSLRRFEAEVVSIAADLLHGSRADGSRVAGSMTSGGSESILMAVKTARERFRALRPGVVAEMVVPVTAHPAFLKAAHYFDVVPRLVPVGPDYRADVDAARGLVGERTALVVGSAPCYPFGVVDPIEELSELARSHGTLFHTDACLGGLLLPFLERLGERIPVWDFRLPGVTSISADVHKYGFAAKGASVVVYRDASLRRHQFFTWADWPGGLYASPSMTGTRPGGAIAAAWAALHHLGEDGYLALVQGILEDTRSLRAGIEAAGLAVLGDPVPGILAFAGDVDVYAVADRMDTRGWHLDRQQRPPALHLMVTPAHRGVVERFSGDLRDSMEEVRGNPVGAGAGQAAMYGALASMPDRSMVGEFLLQFLDGLDLVP